MFSLTSYAQSVLYRAFYRFARGYFFRFRLRIWFGSDWVRLRGTSERANYGEALHALGSCASRAVGGRCSSHLGNSWTAAKGTRRVHEKTHAC